MNVDLNVTKKYIDDGNYDPLRILAMCGDLFPDEKQEKNESFLMNAKCFQKIRICQYPN